jgi:ABC-type uncharacterized transport system permease subunit
MLCVIESADESSKLMFVLDGANRSYYWRRVVHPLVPFLLHCVVCYFTHNARHLFLSRI